jgi:hypothetical protein
MCPSNRNISRSPGPSAPPLAPAERSAGRSRSSPSQPATTPPSSPSSARVSRKPVRQALSSVHERTWLRTSERRGPLRCRPASTIHRTWPKAPKAASGSAAERIKGASGIGFAQGHQLYELVEGIRRLLDTRVEGRTVSWKPAFNWTWCRYTGELSQAVGPAASPSRPAGWFSQVEDGFVPIALGCTYLPRGGERPTPSPS